MMKLINPKGIILLVVLWLLVILSSIALGFGHSMLVEYRATVNDMDKMKTMELAKSGIERAIAMLATDTTQTSDLPSSWNADPTQYQDVALGEGTYTMYFPNLSDDKNVAYGVVDENSKININTASKAMLMNLPGVDDIISDSIIDWRSATARVSPYGAKDEYYSQLNPPYKCKNGPFDSIEELLMVKGVTPQLLYGEDANLNGLLDPNENDGDASFPPDNADGKLDRGLYPYITVYSYDWNVSQDGVTRINLNRANNRDMQTLRQHGLSQQDITNIINQVRRRPFTHLGDILNVQGMNLTKFSTVADYITISNQQKLVGLININTASDAVLITIPGINETLSQQIIERRNGAEGVFKTLGDVANVIGKNPFIQAGDFLTVRASQFRIQSVGRLTDRKAMTRLIAVIDRSVVPMKILYYRDLSYLGAGI